MPLTISNPALPSALEVTAIIIDPQTTEYTVAYVLRDSNGTPLKNGEVRGRVIDENGVVGNTHGVDFSVLYDMLKTWAYGDVIQKTEFTGTVS